MDRIRRNYQPYVMGGEVQPIDGTWYVRVRPYVVRYPNGVTFQSNKSMQVHLGEYAVDNPGSQRWVGIFLDLSKREIFSFAAICEFTKNIGDPIDITKFTELNGKDLVVLADVFLSYGQNKIDEDCITHNRRGEFLMSAASQRSDKNESIEDRLEAININGLPGELAGRDGTDYQVMNKSIADYPKTIGGGRSGIFSFIESPIGAKFITFQGPVRCKGTDTTCGLGDVGNGTCATVDTTCTTANDIVVAQVSDHCDGSCEVGCQVTCQASAQSSCQTACECGHEYSGSLPVHSCATCNTVGCESCEPACEICESPAGHDVRTDRRCHWASEQPDSEFFIPCSSCDNVGDPHNLATCVSCDVQCDAVCQVPDTRTGTYPFMDCSGGAGSLDVAYVHCPTTCENPPSCVSTWQTTCHTCETGCKCLDDPCYESPGISGCVSICKTNDVIIIGDSLVTIENQGYVEETYTVIIGPEYDLVETSVPALEFFQWGEHIGSEIITRQAIHVSSWLGCDWPGSKILGINCTPQNNIEFTIVKKMEVPVGGEKGLPSAGHWYIVLEPVTPSTGGTLQGNCAVPTPPIMANVVIAGGTITAVGCPPGGRDKIESGDGTWRTLWLESSDLRLVKSRTFTLTINWIGIPDPQCPYDTPCTATLETGCRQTEWCATTEGCARKDTSWQTS